MDEKTQKCLIKHADAGKVVAVGEYRLCEAASRGYMSATTGKHEIFSGVWHTVEIGAKSVQVADSGTPDDFAPEGYQTPFKKGEIVVVELQSFGYVKGKGDRWRGLLHKTN